MAELLQPPIELDLETEERCILTLLTHRRICDDGEHILYFRDFVEPLDADAVDPFVEQLVEDDKREKVFAKLYLPMNGDTSAKADEYLDDLADLDEEDDVQQMPGDFGDEVKYPSTIEEGMLWTELQYLSSALHWVVVNEVPLGGLLEDERWMFGMQRGKGAAFEYLSAETNEESDDGDGSAKSPTPPTGRQLKCQRDQKSTRPFGGPAKTHRRQPSVEETVAKLRSMMVTPPSTSPSTPPSSICVTRASISICSLSTTPLLAPDAGNDGEELSGSAAKPEKKADAPSDEPEAWFARHDSLVEAGVTPMLMI